MADIWYSWNEYVVIGVMFMRRAGGIYAVRVQHVHGLYGGRMGHVHGVDVANVICTGF